MRKIALINQKGGCGKTTTAINLASCLSRSGKRVLLIDMDPQGHLGLGLGIQPDEIEKSIYEVLLGQIKINEAIYVTSETLHIILSDVVLSAFEQVMSGIEGRELRLKRCLYDLTNDYDNVIIDNPPSVGLLAFNSLMACNEVIVPVDSCYFSLHGLRKLLETLALIQEKSEQTFIVKILATNIDPRTKYSKTVVDTLKKYFPGQCFDTVIHTGTRLREAASRGKPIADYDNRCRAFHDYQNLTKEVLIAEPALEKVDLSATQPSNIEETVVFTLGAPAHSNVQIAGDFNNWRPEALSFSDMATEPMWQTKFSLKPGSYQYKYLLDGQWIADPDNEHTMDDSFGGINSILKV